MFCRSRAAAERIQKVAKHAKAACSSVPHVQSADSTLIMLVHRALASWVRDDSLAFQALVSRRIGKFPSLHWVDMQRLLVRYNVNLANHIDQVLNGVA